MAQVKVGPLRSEPRPSGINLSEPPRTISGPDKKLTIADIGTGTGIWLIDLAQELGIGKETGAKSNIQLDGFDIDIVQCPQPEWLPENIKFHTWNVFEEPEAQFVGQYDLIYVRLFSINIKNPGWFIGTESVFKDQGFEQICFHDHNNPPMLWRYLYEVWLLTVAEFCRTQLKGTEAGAKYSAMVVQACAESRQGAVIQLGRLALMAKLA
ncbi:hypothetical protein DL771_003676 [Monosporascus sp. 5C6A]|nr:hypothetical protein DL771_003676 [Monosporascus sp. 5C6A]